MDRETREITTPSGKKVKIKTYLTYGEWREIQLVYLDSMKVGFDTEGKTKMDNIAANVAFKAQNKVIEVLVMSINDNAVDVVRQFMDLSKGDVDAILPELNKIQNEWNEEKKTK
jgi:methionine synthase II (cobalamin-independent)